MAPEQARGEQVDRRADVYSVGSLTYRLVTGSPAYPQMGDDLLSAVRSSHFVRPRKVNPEVPPQIEDIILRAMSLDPRDRFPTCGAMRREVVEASRRLSYRSDADSIAALVRRAFPQVPGVNVPAEHVPAPAPGSRQLDPLREALQLASPDEATGLVSLPDALGVFASPDEHTEISPFNGNLEPEPDLRLISGDVMRSPIAADWDEPTNIVGHPGDGPEPPTERSGSYAVGDDEPTRNIVMPPPAPRPSEPPAVGPPPPPVPPPREPRSVEPRPTTPSATPIVRSPSRHGSRKRSARWLVWMVMGFGVGLTLIVISLVLILTPPPPQQAQAATGDDMPATAQPHPIDPALLAGDPELASAFSTAVHDDVLPDPPPTLGDGGADGAAETVDASGGATDGGAIAASDSAVATDAGVAAAPTAMPEPVIDDVTEPRERPEKTLKTSSPPRFVEPPTRPRTTKRVDAPPHAPIKRAQVDRPVPPAPPPAPAPAPAPATSSKSFLTVFITPSAKVYLDGQLIGSSPIAKREVSAGRHSLKVVAHDDPSKTKTLPVTVKAGEHARIRQAL
jgi:hypothetical protein